MPKTILAIESSCDETGVAIISHQDGLIKVLAEAVSSQATTHKKTGGVVPEAAAREHVTIIKPLIAKVVGDSGLTAATIDAIAVTVGPGLQPALSVGVTAAQTLAYAWDKPVIPIHHLEGHIYSALLHQAANSPGQNQNLDKSWPALALIVSGGHTMLVKMTGHLTYAIIGTTRDDAAGEAFDKVARLLDLPYPGGPHLSKLALKGDPTIYKFARPMLHSGDLDFSFSGLKTEVLYTIQNKFSSPSHGKPYAIPDEERANIAAGFQLAVVDTLVAKTKAALEQDAYTTVLLSGGVAANTLLRTELKKMAKQEGVELRIAPPELCGDNATMIGQAAVFAQASGRQTTWDQLDARARWDLPLVHIVTNS